MKLPITEKSTSKLIPKCTPKSIQWCNVPAQKYLASLEAQISGRLQPNSNDATATGQTTTL
jgi:hypothetical protein